MTDPEGLSAAIDRIEARQKAIKDFIVRGFWQLIDREEFPETNFKITCIVCEHTAERHSLKHYVDRCRFGGGRLERYLCENCGCIFGPLKCLSLSPEFFSADYQLLYDSYAEADSTENEIRAFQSLEPERGKLYLNWGCGRWSRSIPVLRDEGYDVWGYEPCAAPEDARFIVSSRNQISAKFQGIFSNNVIEHMVSPVDDFRYFNQILIPGGKMAHATPCYQYRYAFTRFHVLFLLGESPKILAQRTGFHVESTESDGEFGNCIFVAREG